jgi:two-component system sensor histidine kinase KdpD
LPFTGSQRNADRLNNFFIGPPSGSALPDRVDNGEVRRTLLGSAVGIGASAALTFALLPARFHLGLATAALLFVLPVVAAVVVGGFRAGVAGVAAGFLAYDLAFIPPYGHLAVDNDQEWVALAVYAVVMLLVARVVSRLEESRTEAQRRTDEAGRLFRLSELLVEDRSVGELLKTIVGAVESVFGVPGVALLVLDAEHLEVAASAGAPLTQAELHRLDPESGVPVPLGMGPGGRDAIQTVALTASGRPVGMLAVRGMPADQADRALLRTFANHAALALERTELREQALRSELLEEVDRLRHALMGAVSHDLRTPLATMKVAASTLADPARPLSEEDARELAGLIDVETDRLTRLVTSLLDMTRIEAGVLEVRPAPTSVPGLIGEVLDAQRALLSGRPVTTVLADPLPDAEVDHLLVGQVLANLLDNADRHAPPDSLITVTGEVRGDRIALSVADQGPGVPAAEREAVFDRFVRFDTGGRAGLGLAIAKTFVEAHGERIWVEDVPGGGSRFVFTLPTVAANGNGR